MNSRRNIASGYPVTSVTPVTPRVFIFLSFAFAQLYEGKEGKGCKEGKEGKGCKEGKEWKECKEWKEWKECKEGKECKECKGV